MTDEISLYCINIIYLLKIRDRLNHKNNQKELASSSSDLDALHELIEHRELSEKYYSARNINRSLTSALKRYLKNRENENTKRAHLTDLSQFFSYLGKNKIFTLGDLGKIPGYLVKGICEAWLDSLLENGLSKISVQRKKGSLKSFFKFLNQELPQIITFVPALENEKHKQFYNRSKTIPLTRKEWGDFIFFLEKNIKTKKLGLMLQTAMFLGGRRIGEILKLKWSDIDFNENKVFISPSKKRADSTIYILPLPLFLKELLTSYKKNIKYKISINDFVFSDETQQRVDGKLKYYAPKAGIEKKISFHSVRTSFVTWANEEGHTQSEIMNATLHSSTKMVRYYDQTDSLKVNSILKLNF